MADNAESSEKQNFVGEKKKSHGATKHCSYGTCNSDRNRNKFINQIRAPGGHIQLTIMIDTQQQYIKLNIHSEVSIIVVQAHSSRKRDICTYTYTHILMMKSEQKHLGGGGTEQTRVLGDSSPIRKGHQESMPKGLKSYLCKLQTGHIDTEEFPRGSKGERHTYM